MGDNRTENTDCRNFGCILIEKIEGVAYVRIWTFNKLELIFNIASFFDKKVVFLSIDKIELF